MDDFSIDVNRIAADTIAVLAKSAANTVVEKVKKAARDAINRGAVDYGTAFTRYLSAAKERCEKVKTLLYKQDPQSLYSFYVSIGVERGPKKYDTSQVGNILSLGHKLIVTGTGGIGKTIMLKYFFVDCVKHSNLVPVLVELRGLNDREPKEISLVSYIYENLKMYNFGLEEEYFRYSLETGCYLILFDGFDEVKSEIANKVSKEINALSTKYDENYYIVSSRPSDEFVGWQDFVELDALPMTKQQALELVRKLEYDPIVKEKFYRALDDDLFEKYESFASNPLLLTIMLITFDSHASIPEKLNDFYEQAFSAMFNRHDAMKGGFRRDIASRLSYEDFKRAFSYFCFKSYFNSQYEFTYAQAISLIDTARDKILPSAPFTGDDYLHDLTDCVCMLLHEGMNYKFSHRSFQEYFAALYTTQLDDATQKKLLTAWFKNSRQLNLSGYFLMLYDLQPARFIKNLLKPGLYRLNRAYEANGRDLAWLLETLFEDVVYHNFTRGSHDVLNLCVTIKNSYYSTLIDYCCDIQAITFEDLTKQYRVQEERAIDQLQTVVSLEEANMVSFKTLRLSYPTVYHEVVQALGAHRDMFEKSIQFLKAHDNAMLKGKSKISSLLDEL